MSRAAAPVAHDAAPSGEIVDLVTRTVRASGLLPSDASVVVLLSGGRDSVCLLDLAVRACGSPAVCAVHVNYGLRGADADADERHCASLCAGLGVDLETVRARWPDGQSGNLQAWARDLRYAAALRVARELDGDAPQARGERLIATGHTASDQVETILYRLAASPGRRALLGMPAHDGRLVRPLLEISREQSAAYCRARGLAWREDSSNASARFARARVRHGLLPALRALHPAAEANVLRTAALLAEETELLDRLVDDELAGGEEIAVARLAELPAALQRLIVIRLAERATDRLVPQAGERVAEIVALAGQAGNARAELHVGALASAVVERGVLRMAKLPARD